MLFTSDEYEFHAFTGNIILIKYSSSVMWNSLIGDEPELPELQMNSGVYLRLGFEIYDEVLGQD